MQYITHAEARTNVIALGLPPLVLDILDEKPLPRAIELSFRCPSEIFGLSAEEQAIYGHGRITPLWGNTGYMIVAYHHDPSQEGFFRFDIEGGDEQQPIGLNWQQILVDEFKFLWEQETSDEELRKAALLFDFRHLEGLISELAEANLGTFAADEAWYRAFLERLR